ncbi:sigma-70 family RNA polymerase sigma factor [Actinoallomurus vinaceus]|uniref:Sigma-70 family RNA polymerase sigma factor n=1 Tax=Actinoallomurus vinaceus TaxID=1080074 RepID=A0ABP8UJA2_9ACTN
MDPHDRFARVYDEHYPAIVRYAARRVDPERARDVAMETFLVAWRRLDDLPDPPEAVLPWLYGVVRNVLANEQRRNRRWGRLLTRLQTARAPVAEPDHATLTVEAMRVRDAMRRLSPRDQEVLQLIAWEGLDVATAAEVVGCSAKTLSVRLLRARRRLEALLAADDAPSSAASFSGRYATTERSRS